MFTLVVVSISILLSIVRVSGQACNATTPCPASAPCCSEYGYCGSGPQFCLGGCNPFFSNTLNSCQPSPICKSQQYSFADGSRVTAASQFDGDADKYDWTLDGGNFTVSKNNLVMILTKTNSGTRLSSTRFIHYGKITATMKTGRWGGVVTGFITMSNIRDEIDWEWPGDKTTEAQTNFFWQGTNSQGDTSKGLTDTYENYHDYTIDWSPDALVFQIDGQTVRTLKASDYSSGGVSKFPSTPSRIQLSLWPGGDDSQYPGTVSWAGGPINWNDQDYVAAGNQFQVSVKSISVTCNDPQAPTADQVSYVYGQGSTSSKQTIDLSTVSPVIGGTSIGNSTTGSSNSTTTSSTNSTSTSVSSATGTTTALPVASPGSQKNGKPGHHRVGGGSHSNLFEAGQTEAAAPSTTPADGRNATSNRNDGFFGGAEGASNSTLGSGSSSSQSQSTTATSSSTQSTPTSSGNKSGARSLNVSMLPVMSAALVMALALAF